MLDMMARANQNSRCDPTQVSSSVCRTCAAGTDLCRGQHHLKFRARAMRALAARWGFQYIGPPASRWFSPTHPKISPPLPVWFSLACHPYGSRIRQVWNVIEGQQNGVSLLIFDSIIGEGKGVYCTFIACQTEQNPFGTDTSPDRVLQSGGWTSFLSLVTP